MAVSVQGEIHMKKTFSLLFFCTALLTAGAFASSDAFASGGFTGPGSAPSLPVTSVREASSLPNDTLVTMRGHIVQQLRKEKYLFKDATGTIEVEIDNKRWQGVTVGPGDLVEIRGEIDVKRRGRTVDVHSIMKL